MPVQTATSTSGIAIAQAEIATAQDVALRAFGRNVPGPDPIFVFTARATFTIGFVTLAQFQYTERANVAVEFDETRIVNTLPGSCLINAVLSSPGSQPGSFITAQIAYDEPPRSIEAAVTVRNIGSGPGDIYVGAHFEGSGIVQPASPLTSRIVHDPAFPLGVGVVLLAPGEETQMIFRTEPFRAVPGTPFDVISKAGPLFTPGAGFVLDPNGEPLDGEMQRAAQAVVY